MDGSVGLLQQWRDLGMGGNNAGPDHITLYMDHTPPTKKTGPVISITPTSLRHLGPREDP